MLKDTQIANDMSKTLKEMTRQKEKDEDLKIIEYNKEKQRLEFERQQEEQRLKDEKEKEL